MSRARAALLSCALLAGIGAIVLAVTYATEVLVVALVGLAAIILLDNVRELRGT